MARLLYNNSLGTLGASLTSGGNTITFQAAPSWSSIVAGQPNGGDYIPLVLEPPQGSVSTKFEVVYVTAYTAGATTATIQRGCEGTTGVSHANGVVWVHGPTAYDNLFGRGTDAPWAGSSSYDYEFLSNPGGTTPSGWAYEAAVPTGMVYTEYQKLGEIAGGNGNAGLIGQGAPATPFTITARVAYQTGNYAIPVFVKFGASSWIGWLTGSNGSFGLYYGSGTLTTWSGAIAGQNPGIASYGICPVSSFRLTVTSTTILGSYSNDGYTWAALAGSGYNYTGLGAVSGCGIGAANNLAAVISTSWFRVR